MYFCCADFTDSCFSFSWETYRAIKWVHSHSHKKFTNWVIVSLFPIDLANKVCKKYGKNYNILYYVNKFKVHRQCTSIRQTYLSTEDLNSISYCTITNNLASIRSSKGKKKWRCSFFRFTHRQQFFMGFDGEKEQVKTFFFPISLWLSEEMYAIEKLFLPPIFCVSLYFKIEKNSENSFTLLSFS